METNKKSGKIEINPNMDGWSVAQTGWVTINGQKMYVEAGSKIGLGGDIWTPAMEAERQQLLKSN